MTRVMTAHCPPSGPDSAATTRAPTVPGPSCAAENTLAAASATVSGEFHDIATIFATSSKCIRRTHSGEPSQ